ncbi:hypothetical protein [Planctopirus hydrillae]|uniref:Uncharacterized protein n=1 Tax=Planctopirus hydrillae TaxID=1841610 RepID=A0A1C3E7D4_9PLAN|nr:hypothetical protein [Planctopirus hydrillae]ODA29167.1 hypothetical protein A6X21_09545 [Planctopirus hydrillae]
MRKSTWLRMVAVPVLVVAAAGVVSVTKSAFSRTAVAEAGVNEEIKGEGRGGTRGDLQGDFGDIKGEGRGGKRGDLQGDFSEIKGENGGGRRGDALVDPELIKGERGGGRGD